MGVELDSPFLGRSWKRLTAAGRFPVRGRNMQRRHALALGVLLSASVFVTVPGGADTADPFARFLAGDLHVHTTYSHDVCDMLADPTSAQCLEEP